MEEPAGESLGRWLKERCRKEHLSLRQVATKTGLSHTTIGDIIKGTRASPDTIRKLAEAFNESGDHHRLALEDKLLTLAGYRSKRPEGKELTEPMARLLDKLSEFNEPQLRIMERFCNFLGEMLNDINIGGRNTGKEVKDFESRVKNKEV